MPLPQEASLDHVFGLIDTESGNVVGSFRSESEALRAVAAAARAYGEESDAVLTLTLFRWDVSPDDGFIADGADLVRRAMAEVSGAHSQALTSGANGARESGRTKKSAAPRGAEPQPT
jgi:hypothetical protein